jgi:hypothetical protein
MLTIRLEPERRDAGRQRQVVVDRLRDVGDLDRPAGRRVHPAAAERGVVTADRDQVVRPEFLERVDDVPEVGRVFGRVRPGGPEHRPAAGVELAHLLDGQRFDLGGVAGDEVREPVPDADHVEPAVDRLDGDRTDDPVDPGGRTAADDDRQLPARNRVRHECALSWARENAAGERPWRAGPSRERIGTPGAKFKGRGPNPWWYNALR